MNPTQILPSIDLLRWLMFQGGKIVSYSEQITAGDQVSGVITGASNALPYVLLGTAQFTAVISGQTAYSFQQGVNEMAGWAQEGIPLPINFYGSEVTYTIKNSQAQDCLVTLVSCSFNEAVYQQLLQLVKTPLGAN